jgi:hypothetical protein
MPELPTLDRCCKVIGDADGDIHDAYLLGMDEKNAQPPIGSGHGLVMLVTGRVIVYSVGLAEAVSVKLVGFEPCPASGERSGP